MNMIRHNNVATYSNAAIFRSGAERAKQLMDLNAGNNRPASVGIESHEIKRANGREQAFEPRRTPRMIHSRFIVHREADAI
jgi:hypothetical protein